MKDKIQLDWGTIFKYGIILLVIAAVCTALLALTNMVTEPVIAVRNEEANVEAQQSVMPEADSFVPTDELNEIQQVSEQGELIDSFDFAYSGDELVGYTVRTIPKGYGGEITMLTGIDTQGEITGIYILEQSETAGLGARSTEPEFQEQFSGLNSEEDVLVEKNGPAEGNEIEAISGATITSTAVTEGVNASADAVAAAEKLNE